MRLKFGSILSSAFLLISTSSGAQQADNTRNVRSFDISGVRLGMSGAQAIGSLRAHFGANTKLDVRYIMSSVLPRHRMIGFIFVYNGAYTTEVDLLEPIGMSTNSEEVYTVKLKINGSGVNVDNYHDYEDRFVSTALSKYGPPSAQSQSRVLNPFNNPLWCSKMSKYGYNGGQNWPCANSPMMFFSRSGDWLELVLADPNVEPAWEAYLHNQARGNVQDPHM